MPPRHLVALRDPVGKARVADRKAQVDAGGLQDAPRSRALVPRGASNEQLRGFSLRTRTAHVRRWVWMDHDATTRHLLPHVHWSWC